MAKKFVFVAGSSVPLHPTHDYTNCAVCGSRRSLRWAYQYDYNTDLVISQRGSYDFDSHGEWLVCEKCEPKFDPDTLLEV